MSIHNVCPSIHTRTNAAFKKLLKEPLDMLLKLEHKEMLKAILMSPVFSVNPTVAAVAEAIKKAAGKATLKTLSGGVLIAILKANSFVLVD